MTIVFLPVYRKAVSYAVSYGRRWSVLEQMLLVSLAADRHGVAALAKDADLPERLIAEGLINLMRAGWVEVRSTDGGAMFSATAAGRRRATEENLPEELKKRVKWTTLCVERLTGAWLRKDDLELVFKKDLPDDPVVLDPIISTFDPEDESRRSLVYLDRDESFEGFERLSGHPAQVYARLELAFGQVNGLPPYAPMALTDLVLDRAPPDESPAPAPTVAAVDPPTTGMPRDTLGPNDLIVGGAEHLDAIKRCLAQTRTHVVIHSCFLGPNAVEGLMPDFVAAARRNVHVDLLWGLRVNSESGETYPQIEAVKQILKNQDSATRKYVQLSPISSRSHGKILIYDNQETGTWENIVGSCNFLSSDYSQIEVSLRTRSLRLTEQLLSQMIVVQLPASGSWSSTAHRLDRIWNQVRREIGDKEDHGEHPLRLLVDKDHYSCVRTARNEGRRRVVLGCDLYGSSAEYTVLTPLERASELGAQVSVYYHRPADSFTGTGATIDHQAIGDRGIKLEQVDSLHGKFLAWDDAGLAITSFNWLSTAVVGSRVRGAELGVLVRNSDLYETLAEKLAAASDRTIII